MRTALVMMVSVALAGLAGATTIGDVVDAPAQYAGQQVTIVGTVTQETIGYRGESVYTLHDAGKRITVISRANAPAAGDHLQVTATVGFREPDEEFTWPPVLVESGRQLAP